MGKRVWLRDGRVITSTEIPRWSNGDILSFANIKTIES
jgi:hypothetical protein